MQDRHAALLCALLLYAAPAAAAPAAVPEQDAALAPVHQFIDGFNAGDMKAAAAAYAPGATIIDEFPPFMWHGQAFGGWSRDYGKMNKAENSSGAKVTLAAPTEFQMGKGRAYAVIPTHIDYTKDGKPMTEDGSFAFVLKKMGNDWRIAAWAWATK